MHSAPAVGHAVVQPGAPRFRSLYAYEYELVVLLYDQPVLELVRVHVDPPLEYWLPVANGWASVLVYL